ncbi:phosphotransferase family protein [Streptomyces graminilatus]|uniref:phosphotransferase family protein n=1 Tax=Streptomyces graminilatus TaxID=1464070 RepID=UPI0006E28B49|nr:aminoglycoside phosphotransferase family protein [Streptomyces graminilatus]
MGTTSGPLPLLGERATSNGLSAVPAFVAQGRQTGQESSGHHNRNFVLPVTEQVARILGKEAGTPVTVRIPREGALPVVIRTWRNEAEILDALKGKLPLVPECLYRGDGFAVHSYVEGVPLSSLCEYGKRVDTSIIEAQTELIAQAAPVPRTALPPLPSTWPAEDNDSRGFLRVLAHMADKQIRQRNWPVFGALFTRLGVPADALGRYAEAVPEMTSRPFGLLHCDLHRDNQIVSYGDDPPFANVDWELASYGDPLHDLATHLVRMRYPDDQWDDVKSFWSRAMLGVRPRATDGMDRDLGHYVDFERAQSVFPDVIRAAKVLEAACDQRSLDVATASVRRALEAAEKPLKLRNVPAEEEIEEILCQWRFDHCADPSRIWRGSAGPKIRWTLERHFPKRPDFPAAFIHKALEREVRAKDKDVFRDATHSNTVVRVPGFDRPVVVRRKLAEAPRTGGSHVGEHTVLRAIEESGAAVAVPRVLAVGATRPYYEFAIHTYEAPRGNVPPHHSVGWLSPQQANALIDQCAALTEVDTRRLDPVACEKGFDFFGWAKGQLVDMVSQLPTRSRQLAEKLGLPDAEALREIMRPWTVSHRKPALVHGNLSLLNLVPSDHDLELTIVGWDMALVGDPLYDLIRHLYLAGSSSGIRELMIDRWRRRLDPQFTTNMVDDWPVYWNMEVVRSAYVELDRVVAGEAANAFSGRRTEDSYAWILGAATRALGLRPPRPVNPLLFSALR